MNTLSMAVLGDSIMWGQGLRDEQKFSSLVRDALGKQLGREVAIQILLAHSGAPIMPHDAARDEVLDPLWGEIPDYYPSITRQLQAVKTGDQVDLVLVDGGSNDMGDLNLARFWAQASDVYNQTQSFFGERMKLLLPAILNTFPQARVIVTGYYPVVSQETGQTEVEWFLKAFRNALKKEHVLVEDIFKEGVYLLDVAFEVLRHKLANLSTAWADGSTRALRGAVETVNAAEASAGRPQRVNFAPVVFRPENSLGGPRTWLWKGTDDPMHEERVRRAGESRDLGDFLECSFASVGHPNQQGAQAYASAVMAALSPWIEDGHWNLTGVPPRTPRLEVTMQPTPQPGAGQPVTQEVMVLASDQQTTQPVKGTVEIANHDALEFFPTNTPFTFTFHYHEFAASGKDANSTRTRVRVTAPGYDPVWLTWW